VPTERGARLREVDPRLRLCAVVAACCLAAGARSPRTPAALLFFACAALHLHGVRATALLRSLSRVAAIGGLAVALKLALTPGEPLLPGAPPPLGAVTREGACAAALLATRLLAAAALLRWLVASTAPAELESALAGLGAPRPLVELVSFAHRFVHVLRRTAESAWSAAALRSGFARTRAAARSAGVVAGVVALRMLERSERAADALRLRGYRGNLPVAAQARGARDANLAFAAVAAAALMLSAAAGGAR
jgi:cobalt/nickel transport system permease protein